jgi:hypothetical protein
MILLITDINMTKKRNKHLHYLHKDKIKDQVHLIYHFLNKY